MKQSNVSKHAYLAGLIDGEGSIGANKVKNKSYSMELRIGLSDGRIIDWLYGNFGGSIYRQIHDTHFGDKEYKNTTIYTWYIQNHKAAEILKRVLPFLKLKKSQAEQYIRLSSRMNVANRKRIGNKVFAPLSEHELKIRDEICQRLHDLKKDLRPSLALETKRGNQCESIESNSPTPKEE